MNQRNNGRHVVGLFVALAVVACAPIASAGTPSPPTICDGVPADMGGCSSTRPVLTGSTCEGIAEEWATTINDQVLTIIGGPAVADGKQRSSRISDAVVVASIVAGMRLADLELIESCDSPAFLEAALPTFSDELRAAIPAHLYDGQPVASVGDWEAALERAIGIIDEGE